MTFWRIRFSHDYKVDFEYLFYFVNNKPKSRVRKIRFFRLIITVLFRYTLCENNKNNKSKKRVLEGVSDKEKNMKHKTKHRARFLFKWEV